MCEPSVGTLDERAFEMARRSGSSYERLHRLVQLLRYYDKVKIARRGINVLSKKLRPGKKVGRFADEDASLREQPVVKKLAKRIVSGQKGHPSHSRCDPANGCFVMLNKRVKFSSGFFDKKALAAQTHLWRFQYHYHEHLMAQAAANSWGSVDSFLDTWLEAFNPVHTLRRDDSWHPYCISRRLPVWIWLLHESMDPGIGIHPALSARMLKSLLHQANYLSKNLEHDLGGNHLLENATTLAIVGGTVESVHSHRWRQLAAHIFQKELPKQVLPHGEHFEFSPMYHCQILSNLLRVAICCAEDARLMSIVTPRISPMLNFLSDIVHPDGEIPLLADSVFHESPSVNEICAVADIAEVRSGSLTEDHREPAVTSIGGYRVFRSKKLFVLCDFGPIAAPNLPAHGHCDVSNLEVSVEGQRWITDSGNFNYADDAMRHYCRSSIAHNVVTVDDENQASIWSKFRMGHRPQVSEVTRLRSKGWYCWSASHNGYKSLGVPKITRSIAVCDQAMACVDIVSSGSRNRLVGYLHLHPEVEVVQTDVAIDGLNRHFNFRTRRNGIRRQLTMLADDVTIENGWYCPVFGQRRPAPVLRYVTEVGGGVTGWMLHDLGVDAEMQCSNESFAIMIGAKRVFFEFEVHEILNED